MSVFLGGQMNSGGGVPIGVVLMWSGSLVDVPDGWHVCDGKDGTIDLTNRFVLGAGGTYNVGATGGEEKHTLSISEMPAHNHGSAGNHSHSINCSDVSGGGIVCNGPGSRPISSAYTSGGGEHSHGNQGSDAPHNNMPPYFCLYYIQKIS